MNLKKTIPIIFFIITIFFFSSTQAITPSYIWSDSGTSLLETVSDTETDLKLESGGAILIEQSTGSVLYDHNSHEKFRPASVTKVMSLLLIMEALDNGEIKLSDEVTCSKNAASMGGSQIWLEDNEVLTVDEMLKAICLNSANDCVVAMAEHLAGSEEEFVTRMNNKAKSLSMNDTTFKNCHGLDEDGHLTSAYDIALMSKELLSNHPNITKYTSTYMDTLRDGKTELVNTNKLVRNYNGCTGLKTGSTSLALFNLSASATRDGLSLISVIMHSPSSSVRFSEAQKLLNFGFSNFTNVSFGDKNDVIGTLDVEKGVTSSVNAILSENASFFIKKSKSSNVVQNVTFKENLEAPIEKGEVLGTVTYTLDNEVIKSINIIAEENVKRLNIFNMLTNVYGNWFSLLR